MNIIKALCVVLLAVVPVQAQFGGGGTFSGVPAERITPGKFQTGVYDFGGSTVTVGTADIGQLETDVADLNVSTISLQDDVITLTASTVSINAEVLILSVSTTSLNGDILGNSSQLTQVATDTTTLKNDIDTKVSQSEFNTFETDVNLSTSATETFKTDTTLSTDTLRTDVNAKVAQSEYDTFEADVNTSTSATNTQLTTVATDTTTLFNQKLATTTASMSGDLNVLVGSVTASAFFGDGSNLTGVAGGGVQATDTTTWKGSNNYELSEASFTVKGDDAANALSINRGGFIDFSCNRTSFDDEDLVCIKESLKLDGSTGEFVLDFVLPGGEFMFIQGSSADGIEFGGETAGNHFRLSALEKRTTFFGQIHINDDGSQGSIQLRMNDEDTGIYGNATGGRNIGFAVNGFEVAQINADGDSVLGLLNKGVFTGPNLCAEACSTHNGTTKGCMAYNSTDFSLYTSTGSAVCQWLSMRDGGGP